MMKSNKPNKIWLDSASKKAVRYIEKIKFDSFDDHKVWQKISDRLENMDKKVLSWFMLTATSFTMLVAAGLEYVDISRATKKEEMAQLEKATSSNYHLPTQKREKAEPLAYLKSKPNPNKAPLLKENKPYKGTLIFSSTNVKTSSPKHYSYQGKYQSASSPKVNISGSTGYTRQSFSPTIGFEINILRKQQSASVKQLSTGLSLQYLQHNNTNESNTIGRHLYSFVNLGYETYNMESNKGWKIGTGYLINPDGILFKNATMKFTVSRRINKHIKLGPEVYFTNGFKKAYPGVSLTISS